MKMYDPNEVIDPNDIDPYREPIVSIDADQDIQEFIDECLMSNMYDLDYSEYEQSVVRAYVEDFVFLHSDEETRVLLATLQPYTTRQIDVLIDTIEMFMCRIERTNDIVLAASKEFLVERIRTSHFTAVEDITF